MKKILLVSTIVITFLITSCGKKLDIQPENTIDASLALGTSSDVEALLVGAYDNLGDNDLWGGNLMRDAELLGDDGGISWSGTFTGPSEIFRKNMLTTNDQALSTWTEGYRTINITNNVLANLKVVDASKVASVEGEAKFIRGVVLFELVRKFAKAWGDGDANSNPGIPLVLTPTLKVDETLKLPRSTVAAVYAQVIKDLTDAKTLLPEENDKFANTFVASAILARVYLMQSDYQKAAAEANTVIESGYYELETNIANVFNLSESGYSSEDIFSTKVTSQDGANSMHTFFAARALQGRGDIRINTKHLNLYESGDLRKNLFYTSSSRVYCAKWATQYGAVNIVRLSEMYLTRAEANFRTSGTLGDTPLNDINLIRSRAGLGSLTIAQLNIASILKERKLELAFEGHLLNDIKRTKQSIAVTNSAGTVTATYPFNDPKLIFPIPQREIDVNKNLEQNDAYK